MTDTADTEYENLSKEEREARDKADRAREVAEQAALPYSWTQELGDVDVTVTVPRGTRARDLSITIEKKKLSIGLKSKEPIMAGELCKEIKVEDSTWTLQDGQSVLVHLEKANKMTWWENVLTHHPKIDTRKIEPPNGKLSDLDGETRQVLRRRFDSQQRQMGKPTSDELKKMEALKKFQAAHPELDFSQAKIS
ncbi:nuclear movement protein nudC [Amanita muscaria]